jgi:hypothetical protein
VAYPITFLTLQTTILQRCHMENSQVVTTAELKQYINDSGTEFNERLADAYGEKYTMKRATFSLTPNTEIYTIASAPISAADFMQLHRMEYSVSGKWLPVEEFKLAEAEYFQDPFGVGPVLAYRFEGPALVFAPVPRVAYSMRMFYSPIWTILVNDADTVDTINGWHELIIVDVCIKILAKQDLPCGVFMAQKTAMLKRIDEIKQQRNVAAAPRIVDVTSDLMDRFTTRSRWPT